MDGHAFEDWVAARLRRRGWKVRRRSFSADGGVDLEGFAPDGRSAIVQCKKTSAPVGEAVIRDVTGAAFHGDVEMWAVVSAGGFTAPARRFAEDVGVLLLEPEDL
jgi:restriction system protein